MRRTLLFITILLSAALIPLMGQEAGIPRPAPHQLKWHEAEMGVVFHYDLHVFDGIRYGQGNNRVQPIEDYNIFNPKKLDTDQWIRAAKAAGAKFAVLTATHETGFAIYQSDVNPYCLKAVKWRDGKGDVIRDFVNSCRKYDIMPGIYVGIRWNSLLGIHNFMAQGEGEFAANRQQWYKHFCERMVEELCTRYGDLFMIWFDGGADDPKGNGPDVLPIISKYQPECLFYHNVDRADFRWGGSESGTVGYPCWSSFPYPYSHSNNTEGSRNHTDLLRHGDKDGQYWVPAMADTPLRGMNGRHEWFWEPDDDGNIYPVDSLMNMYYKSVGRNATLIVGLTPDTTGLIPAGDVERLKEWGNEIGRRFSSPLASTSGQKKSLTLKLGKLQPVNHCIIQENISNGERIRQYKIEARVNGKWQTVSQGESVGHKRIEQFPTVNASALRLTVTQSIAQPDIRNFSAFCVQPSFVYEKGKGFDKIAAFPMPASIDLGKQQAAICREKSVPAGQTAIVYSTTIPAYRQGIFFSRDSRPGDYLWPNNTNRLLPWVFNRLEDLTKDTYPGIPSNGSPSVLGDALLLELADGQFLFAKAVAGDNSISWLRVNPDGTLNVFLSTLGEDQLAQEAPVLLIEEGRTTYEAIRKAYTAFIGNREVSALQKRADKDYFEAFNYLGWCSWEHYHADIDEAKILHDIDAIEASGLPIRYVLIDDGHLASKNRQLTSFVPNKERFPNGWKNIMARKKEDKVKWMGLWYSFSGYWMGISPENNFPEKIQQTLYPYNGTLLPGKSKENIDTFYQYYVGTLKENGFDFLKIDNQSFLLPLYMGNTEVIRQAKACNLALEEETHSQQVGLMNCMAQNILNTDHIRYSGVARVSIDYKKYDEDMAKSHLYQSYTNTLLQGQTVWPDHDMFHSCDTVCGALMARSKALSGGPVYLSDSPTDFMKENILPLINKEGKLFRPTAPAIPTPESIITNPLQGGKAYRVFAPTGDEAVSLICYNLNTSPLHTTVKATISKDDYLLRETLTGKATSPDIRIILYDWQKQTATELTADRQMELTGFTDRLFHLCPINSGWAVIGMQEKFLSPATVRIEACNQRQLVLNVLCPGTLKVWADTGSKQELRSIPVSAPGKITINK